MKIVGKILLTVFLVMLATFVKALGFPGWGLVMGGCAVGIYFLWRRSRKPKIPTAQEAKERFKATHEAAQQLLKN